MIKLLFASDGTALQDEIGHYIISRDAIANPELILDLWGRTLHTILYILPAQFGLDGARLASVGLAALTVIVSIGSQGNWLSPASSYPSYCYFSPGSRLLPSWL